METERDGENRRMERGEGRGEEWRGEVMGDD